MSAETGFVVRIGEDGSDGRRLDWLTAELRDLLDGERGCMARHAERQPDGTSPKSPLEIVPGAITLVVGVAANLRGVVALLAQWLHRDDLRHMRVSYFEGGAEVEVEVTGMSAAQMEAMLVAALKAGACRDDES
jgi:hypothetical protein